ncbi:STAS domain-containing protein [Modestobacter marinus]|uniref:STAS domain-containing protein n=1 Tax=Modestobacter marinus TaxID=477641 RepID=UPI001C952AEC|nr:STAS domain-containing protein [Modestobacter marinus]
MDLPTTPPPFSTTVRSATTSATTVVVHGEVDALTGPQLERTLTAAWAGAPASLLVDLSAVSFVNASSLAVLFRAGDEARTRAAGFDVRGLPRPVERFLAGRQLTLAVIAA